MTAGLGSSRRALRSEGGRVLSNVKRWWTRSALPARAWLVLFVLLASIGVPRPARAGDPYLRFRTIHTPHFRVHYHGGLERLARRAAQQAEAIHEALVPDLGWAPSEPTQLVLADDSDFANGYGSGVPYNAIRLHVSAPDDMSSLQDYDDWLANMITHEYTHILHIDNLSGIPALLNTLFGRVSVPNQSQPRWILEGFAVAMESAHSSSGRLRSTLFDMYLRADALEDNLAALDEISGPTRRWPGGELWYLYGAKFVEWITETYGPDTLARIASEYGSMPIPFAINRAVRRVTSRTYPELYAGFQSSIAERTREFVAGVRARGLREGRRLTFGQRISRAPRFVPAACRETASPQVSYYRDDSLGKPGLYRFLLGSHGVASPELIARSSGGAHSYTPECQIVFDSLAPSARYYQFLDLFRVPPRAHDMSRFDLRRERLTVGARAREPDVSPDGRQLTYVTNDAGTTTLKLAELTARGIERERVLVPSAEFEQAYTPRFSPDGRRIAYSAWTAGGFRDIRVVDVASGRFFELWHDRAIDQQPTWSRDGSTLYFVSDRTGAANVYAYELASGRLWQVTNVLTGAYMPEISDDGRTLLYVGYTSGGFDVFALELDPSKFLEPIPSVARAAHPIAHRARALDARGQRPFADQPYDPLPTLRPRAYRLEYGPGTFGDAITVKTRGSDVLDYHTILASVILEAREPDWRGSLDYTYDRLPFSLHLSAFHDAAPSYVYRFEEPRERHVDYSNGVTSGIGWSIPGEYDTQTLGFSFTTAGITRAEAVPKPREPYDPLPRTTSVGLYAGARLAYSYGNAEGSLHGVSAERGFNLFLALDVADPAFGSDWRLAAFTGALTTYFSMPWARHHVLALALSGGGSSGSYPRSYFHTGGFVDHNAFDVFRTGFRQSGFVLRGYEPGQFIGSEYTLLNVEYRFPLLYADRGLSTLPLFLQQVSGTLFADYGGAYEQVDPKDPLRVMHLGLGGELWLELVLGYRYSGSLRLGVARGTGEMAHGVQSYFVAAAAF
ncbi:MAG TPA: BamA/TamA family outer membrane protein [Polyangiaceae bacterium]|nr:BamA/TamA family outer membrane protein [Polyangiaceae bacterium]